MSGPGAQPVRRPPVSLRLKLTLWIVLIAGIIQLTVVVLAVLYLRLTLAGFFDRRLETRAGIVADALARGATRPIDEDLAAFAAQSQRSGGFERLAITLYDQDGSVIASSLRPAPPLGDSATQPIPATLGSSTALFARRDLPGLHIADERYPARVMIQPIAGADGRTMILLVAATDRTYQAMMEVTARVIAFTLPAGILAAAIAGWLVSGIAIAPLERLRRLTLMLSPETLHRQHTEPLGQFREAAELERALEETRAKLDYAFRAQDRFIANVSHELKTPIAVVLAEAQTLSREDLSPAARGFAASTSEEMQRLATMIEKFLTLTRIKGGASLQNAVPADINAVAMEAVMNCQKMARQSRIELVPELADTERAIQVLGEAEQLQLMLVNLLQNAIRFSPRDKRVILRVAQSQNECHVTVRDFGQGISPDLLSTLFDRFAADPGDGKRGHGVGLAIAQGIAELHGGQITVRNLADGGCEFSVRLPLAPDTGTRPRN